MEILIPVVTLGSLGFLFGISLAFAQKVFSVQEDPKLKKIMHILPGSNCGACGKAGCFAMAEAMLGYQAEPTACVLASKEEVEKIADVLGIQVQTRTKEYAEILCNGGKIAKDKYEYFGVRDCTAANILEGGQKACRYGCLGFGSCVKACPFGAIFMSEENLPVVIKEKCVGCGRCVKACPKKIIRLFPSDVEFYIKCSSNDPGALVMKVCKNGCIACGKCVRACPQKAIRIENNLAVVDYSKCKRCEECIKVCPTKVIKQIRLPQPCHK